MSIKAETYVYLISLCGLHRLIMGLVQLTHMHYVYFFSQSTTHIHLYEYLCILLTYPNIPVLYICMLFQLSVTFVICILQKVLVPILFATFSFKLTAPLKICKLVPILTLLWHTYFNLFKWSLVLLLLVHLYPILFIL